MERDMNVQDALREEHREVVEELHREVEADRDEDRFLTEPRDTRRIDRLFLVLVAIAAALCLWGVLAHLFV